MEMVTLSLMHVERTSHEFQQWVPQLTNESKLLLLLEHTHATYFAHPTYCHHHLYLSNALHHVLMFLLPLVVGQSETLEVGDVKME